MVKFSHIADCHLGAFGRNPTLREYNLRAFEEVIEKSIQEEVDFIIIAGDLFHNPHPDMDVVDRAVKSLVKARKKDIRIYSVYGSHDFNIAKASLVDVLESADLFKKVVHYLDESQSLEHVQDKSGVKITGLSGRKSRKDTSYYKELNFIEPDGDAIFVFHTPVSEMKPVDIHEKETVPLSSIPDGYKYYAGGHIHRNLREEKDGSPIIYPGVTFGSSYTDLENDLDRGFYIVDDWEPIYVPVDVCEIRRVNIDAEGLLPSELEEELLDLSRGETHEDVVLVKVSGVLREGVPEDIDFMSVRRKIEEVGAETVFLNRRNLEGKNVERLKIKEKDDAEIEDTILDEYSFNDLVNKKFAKDLLNVLKVEQGDGETNTDYDDRVWHEAWNLIDNLDKYEDIDEEKSDSSEKVVEEVEKKDDTGEKNGQKGQFSLTDFGGD
ncbi:MAG: DNA repair exonuclease [Candidatus Saliniplasma sp.]